MKRFALLLCISLAAHMSVAQNINEILKEGILLHGPDVQPVSKATSGTGSRLVSYAYLVNDAVSYVYSDSFHLQYSGTRGGDFIHIPIKYDTALGMHYNTATSLWVNQVQYTQNFDANNNLTDQTQKVWYAVTSIWVNYMHNVYTYDAAGNMLTNISQLWNTPLAAWDNDNKNSYTYDANNNQITNTYQAWNTVNAVWDNSQKTTNVFNAANKITVSIFQLWNTAMATWDNSVRHTYTYDANNNKLTDLNESWNGSTNMWDKYSQKLYTYGPSNELLTQVNQDWNGSTWDNVKKYNYSNFSGINPMLEIDQNWNSNTSSWDNFERYQNTYNAYGQYLDRYQDSWNVGGFWQPVSGDFAYRFHYEEYSTDVKNVSAIGGSANVYPVPASDKLNIDITWDEPQAFTINLFDIQGRISRSWQMPSSKTFHHAIPVAELPAGTYFLRIDGTQGHIVKQLLIFAR